VVKTAEVLATCGEEPARPLQIPGLRDLHGSAASDVLAVQLLLEEARLQQPIRVVPLFETLTEPDHQRDQSAAGATRLPRSLIDE
jgi:phosphoenolpyruvate carboxylase